MIAAPLHDYEVALWFCVKCQHSGVLKVERATVYDVIEGLTKIHSDLSKNLCDATIGPQGLQILRPTFWLREVNSRWVLPHADPS